MKPLSKKRAYFFRGYKIQGKRNVKLAILLSDESSTSTILVGHVDFWQKYAKGTGGGIGTKSFPIVLKGLWDVKRGLRNDIGRPHIEVI